MNVMILTKRVCELEKEKHELNQRIEHAKKVLLCSILATPQSLYDLVHKILNGDDFTSEIGFNSEKSDARRMRWLLDGNGYFMAENFLCSSVNSNEDEKNKVRTIIDEAMKDVKTRTTS